MTGSEVGIIFNDSGREVGEISASFVMIVALCPGGVAAI